jgi:alpha-beta hydrolase superfamily lysophospholipase
MADQLDFDGPDGLKVRGTLLVVPGRGESAASYRRLGNRLAADAYRVRVLAAPDGLGRPAPDLDGLAGALTAAVRSLGDDAVRPLVLVGADVAAAALAALVAGAGPQAPWWPDALVLAGIPGYGTHDTGTGWEAELAARTHCPAQRGVLSGDPLVRPGQLAAAVSDALLDDAYGTTVALPHLLLVGEHDPVADRGALARLAKALPTARLATVRGAHHDVLNDLQHRSVAAEIVSFLEVVRDGTPPQVIVSVESSAW